MPKTRCLFMYASPKISKTSSISSSICSRSFSFSVAVESPLSVICIAKNLLATTGGITSSKVSAHSRLIALCLAGVGTILGGASVSPGKREERRERSSGGSSLGDNRYVAMRLPRNLQKRRLAGPLQNKFSSGSSICKSCRSRP